MRRCDVVVVGGGAMGSAAAWWLARRGRDVVVLERFEQGHLRGSSHGASRIFRLAYPEPEYVRLAREALPLWRELEDDTGAELLTVTGGVDHGLPGSVGLVADALSLCGVDYRTLAPAEAAERWAGMHFAGPVLFQPDAGRVHADRTVLALQMRAEALGAELRFEEPLESLDTLGGAVVVRTRLDEYRSPVAVVACGAWAPKVLTTHAALPKLTVTQEQVFHFAPADPEHAWPSFIHHRAPFVYGLETPGEGVKVAEHHTGPQTDPDERDFAVEPAGRARVGAYVAEWLPGLIVPPAGETTCLYATTATQDFVIDRADPLVVGAGFSGHGFKFTPLIGRLLADLVAGEPAPARFALDGR